MLERKMEALEIREDDKSEGELKSSAANEELESNDEEGGELSVQFVKQGTFKKLYRLESGILAKGENGTIVKRASRVSDGMSVNCLIINKSHDKAERASQEKSMLETSIVETYGQEVHQHILRDCLWQCVGPVVQLSMFMSGCYWRFSVLFVEYIQNT